MHTTAPFLGVCSSRLVLDNRVTFAGLAYEYRNWSVTRKLFAHVCSFVRRLTITITTPRDSYAEERIVSSLKKIASFRACAPKKSHRRCIARNNYVKMKIRERQLSQNVIIYRIVICAALFVLKINGDERDARMRQSVCALMTQDSHRHAIAVDSFVLEHRSNRSSVTALPVAVQPPDSQHES